MKWVNCERPKIDRIICPWLMARFIDKASEFPYVPAASDALSLGLSKTPSDDHKMLAPGPVMHDALYAWCKSCQEETHNWPPQMGAVGAT